MKSKSPIYFNLQYFYGIGSQHQWRSHKGEVTTPHGASNDVILTSFSDIYFEVLEFVIDDLVLLLSK